MNPVIQFECEFGAELPPPPPKPIGVYFAAAWYVGRGCRQKGGSWRLFTDRLFATELAAKSFLESLNDYHKHRRVYFVK